jgi:hypothetical protein
MFIRFMEADMRIRILRLISGGQSLPFAIVILILAGCGPRPREPLQLCPGKDSVEEAMAVLRSRYENAVPIRANGRCVLQHYPEGKKRKDTFPVKIWVNPPVELYLQGDVAFDPRAIVLGSNQNEFWLAMRPKEASTYCWGQWSNERCLEELAISPGLVLEALGLVMLDNEDGDRWSLSHEEAFDVLTKTNAEGVIVKSIYIYCCDYTVRKVVYFSAKRYAVIAELGRYKQVVEGFSIPTTVKTGRITRQTGRVTDTITLNLTSVKPMKFNEKARKRIFRRREPKGFKHVYKFDERCRMVEQPQ